MQTQRKISEHHTDIKQALILTCNFSPINFGHKIYWNRLFLFRQYNNVHIFLLAQLIYEGSEVLLSKVKVYFLGGYKTVSSGWDVSETVSLPDVNLSHSDTILYDLTSFNYLTLWIVFWFSITDQWALNSQFFAFLCNNSTYVNTSPGKFLWTFMEFMIIKFSSCSFEFQSYRNKFNPIPCLWRITLGLPDAGVQVGTQASVEMGQGTLALPPPWPPSPAAVGLVMHTISPLLSK